MANNFENQAKNLMQDFEWPPTQKVWQGVESALDRKKKRRIGILWILLLFLSAGGIFYSIHENHSEVTGSETLTTASKKMQNRQQLPNIVNEAAASDENTEISKNNSTNTQQNTTISSNIERQAQKTQKQFSQNQKRTQIHFRGTQKGRSNSTIAQGIPNEPMPADSITDVQAVASNNTTTSNEVKIDGTIVPSIQTTSDNTESKKSASATAAAIQTKDNDTTGIQKTAKNNSHQKKWSLLFNIETGVGATGSALLNDPANSTAMLSDLTSSPGTGSNMGSSSYLPTATHKNIALGFGLLISHSSVNDKFRIQTGIQYQFLQTKQQTGSVSFINFAARAARFNYGTTSWYTNRFHLLRVPVELQYNFKQKGILQPAFLTGFSVATRISANALQSNDLLAVYYNDNSLFRKWFIELHAGIPLRFVSSTKKEWQIIPEIRYQINSMGTSGYYKYRHLSFAGICFRKLL